MSPFKPILAVLNLFARISSWMFGKLNAVATWVLQHWIETVVGVLLTTGGAVAGIQIDEKILDANQDPPRHATLSEKDVKAISQVFDGKIQAFEERMKSDILELQQIANDTTKANQTSHTTIIESIECVRVRLTNAAGMLHGITKRLDDMDAKPGQNER